MPCPHAQFTKDGNRFGAYEPLSTYISSSSECPECELLLRVVENYKPGWIEEKKLDDGLIYVLHRSGAVVISLLVGKPFDDGREWLADTTVVDSFSLLRHSPEDPLYDSFSGDYWSYSGKILRQSLDIVPDSGSELAFDRATKWLSHCLSHDVNCGAHASTYAPRRLLNLGLGVESHEPILFEPTEPVPYVCLSYCWGNDIKDVLTTTTKTLETHYHGIRLSSLPRTIYDAVIFCRGLKLQYLWVDSLCIVQDDRESWLVDSAQMREIYSNALITLAIEEPASCKTGFLGKQRFGSEWQQKLVANILPEAGGPGKALFIRPPTSQSPDGAQRCSLDKRGWCLQESILSKRRLCFDGNEMTWECAHRTICECGHTSWAPRSMDFAKLGHSLRPQLENLRQNNPFGHWRKVVEEYSNRSLTEAGDKLIAISALAKLIHENFKNSEGERHTYLAGLWKKEFLYDITWSVVPSSYKHRSITQFRAPTWSWASLDAPVEYKFREGVSSWKYKPNLLPDCKIDAVVSVPVVASDPTGPVLSAYAQITAPLVPVCRDGLQQASVLLDRPDEFAHCEERGDQDPCRRQCCWNGEGNDELQSFNAPYYLLRLFTYVGFTGRRFYGSDKKMVMGPEIWFLVLKDSSVVKGAYERVGVGQWNRQSGKWDSREEYCPLFQRCKTRSIKIV